MPRLIDADALKKCIGCADAVKYGNKTTEQQHNSYSTMMMYEIADYIDDMPTIEAEPVRHGRWIEVRPWRVNKQTTLKCSLCNTWQPIYDHDSWNWCPFCGAKMDGGAEDD